LNKKQVILFASGGGSNVKAILHYFKNNPNLHFPLIVCNKKQAGVIEIAHKNNIDVKLISKEEFQSEGFVEFLSSFSPDLIVLAGFLWQIPALMVQTFTNKIINIHPALLPKYGGKGMYGHHVHEAVVNNKESESGITIHYVNEHYDEGNIIFQDKVSLSPNDDALAVAKKVLSLEHANFPKVIEQLLFGE
jgi:phosphoribosylglycinamide formyltransferase 1